MHWFDEASINDKLSALFIYLNNGDAIDAPMIAKLLKHVYRETKDVGDKLSFDFNLYRNSSRMTFV